MVPFTTKALTRKALEKVGEISSGLNVRVRLICVQYVPYPSPLSCPPVSLAFFQSAVEDILGDREAQIQLYLTRDPGSTWSSCITPGSPVVIVTRVSHFQTPEQKLAGRLRRNGHHVLCFTNDEYRPSRLVVHFAALKHHAALRWPLVNLWFLLISLIGLLLLRTVRFEQSLL